MNINHFLQLMVEHQASDLYFTTNAPAAMKVDGRLRAVNKTPLGAKAIEQLLYPLLSDKQQKEYEATHELNLAIHQPDIGRFRVNLLQQRNDPGAVIRRINDEIPSMEFLGLPPILRELSMAKRGLILFVGATGSGKSTSLASMVDHRNRHSGGHIITVEDPIEYTHRHHKSLITQREVGIDTDSYEIALQNTLRQAPDVIMIGEVRSAETMQKAIQFSETGHLCLTTLHANNANQAIDRIINFFPRDQANHLLLDLSMNLRAMVSQRLIPSEQGKRIGAFEVMINTPAIADLIREGQINDIRELMLRDNAHGMQAFDVSLFELYKAGKISEENALKNADSAHNLRLRIQLDKGGDLEAARGLVIDEN